MRRTSLSTHTREMMSLLLVIVLILLSCPPLCTAFLARMQRQHPQQHPQQLQHVSGERVGSKSDGSKRESRTSTSRSSSLAFAVRGAVPDCGQAGRDRHGKPRGRQACRPKPRAMSPLDARTDRHGNSRVAPLKALNPDTVYSVNDWIAGLAGGSVGVLGTLIQLELKQEKLKTRRNCPYCDGSGKLVCALCCSAGTFTTKLPGAETYSTLPCPGCAGERYINCLNCRGDGRAVPRELDRKTADAAEVDLRLEEIGMGGMGQ